MHAQQSNNTAPTILKALFLVLTLLVVTAVGYAGWIVVRYWDRVGV